MVIISQNPLLVQSYFQENRVFIRIDAFFLRFLREIPPLHGYRRVVLEKRGHFDYKNAKRKSTAPEYRASFRRDNYCWFFIAAKHSLQ